VADYEACNGVTIGSLEACNGVSKANIEAINGLTVPAAATGATRWVIATQNGYIAHAANSDRTSWSSYDGYAESGGQNDGDSESIAFGKNASGQSIFCASRATANSGSQTIEITVSGTDVTSTGTWQNIDIDGDTGHKQALMDVIWGAATDGATAGVWLAVGKQFNKTVHRSTNGASSFSSVSLAGLTGHVGGSASSEYINGAASDGAGRFMFAQGPRIYYSTDSAASFAVSTPFSSQTPGRAQNIVFTKGVGGAVDSWVLAYSRQSKINFRSCAASDITDWGAETRANNMQQTTTNGRNVKMATAGGRVAAFTESHTKLYRFDVDGKTISNLTEITLPETPRDIACDGTTWLISCNDGHILESTDNAETWTKIVDGYQADGSTALDLEAITCDVILPI